MQNDFVKYMGQPPNPAWGLPPQTGHMGPPMSWIGSPPVMPQYIGLGQLLSPYVGNVGALVGNFLDAAPAHPYFPSHTNFMQAGRSVHHMQVVQQLAQQNASLLEERLKARLRHMTGLTDADLSTGLGQLMVQKLAGSEFVHQMFRSLSPTGLMALTGALSTYGNAFRPSARDVSLLQTEFYNYYGLLPGQDENINRTFGLSVDELADVVNVTSHSIGRAGRLAAFEKAERQVRAFHVRTVGDIVKRAIKDAGGWAVSDQEWEQALAKTNYNIPEAVEMMARSRKDLDEKDVEEIHTKVLTESQQRAKAQFGTTNVSAEGLMYRSIVEQGKGLAQTFAIFKDAGFQGSLPQLLEQLEHIIGSERFDLGKLRSLGDQMRTLTKVTGMTLDSLFGLFETIDKSLSGSNLGARRSTFITTVAATAGLDLSGSVSRSGMALYQQSVAEAAANPAKSTFGLALDVFRLTGREDIVREYRQLPPAQRQAWLRSKIVEHAQDNPLLQALLRGDTDLVMSAVRDMQSDEDAIKEEYEALKSSSETWSSMSVSFDRQGLARVFHEAQAKQSNLTGMLREAATNAEAFEAHKAQIEAAFDHKLSAQDAIRLHRISEKADRIAYLSDKKKLYGLSTEEQAEYEKGVRELYADVRQNRHLVESYISFSGAQDSKAQRFLELVREAQQRGTDLEDIVDSSESIRQHARAAAEEVQATMPQVLQDELARVGESLGVVGDREAQIRLGAAYVAMQERSAQLQKQTGQVITHDEIMKVIEDTAQQQGIRIDKSAQASRRDIAARSTNATSMARMAYGGKTIETMTILGYSEHVAQWDKQKTEQMRQHASLMTIGTGFENLAQALGGTGYDTRKLTENLKQALSDMRSAGELDEATTNLLTRIIEKGDQEGLDQLGQLAQIEAQLSSLDRSDPKQAAKFASLTRRKQQLRENLTNRFGVSVQTLDTFVQSAQRGALDKLIDAANQAGAARIAERRLELAGQLLVTIKEGDKERKGEGTLQGTAQAPAGAKPEATAPAMRGGP